MIAPRGTVEEPTKAWSPAADETPTRVAPALREPSLDAPSRSKTITSVADVLEDEERARTRLLGMAGVVVNALGLAALPLFGGTATTRIAFVIGLAIHAACNLGLYFSARSPHRFTERWLMPLWCSSFVGLHLVIYYFGTLTVAAIALVLGLYIVSTTRFAGVSRASFAVVAGGTALMTGLQVANVLPDEGIVPLRTASLTQIAGMLVLLEAMFVTVLFIGSGARSNLEQALDALGHAQRALAQREALLEEARHEFDRLERKGARGRLTGIRVGGFELRELLGVGGMGEIYEAVDDAQRSAAVKVLTREGSHQPEVLKRFFRECNIVRELRSPHVVKVLATGGPPDEVPFIAMERLRGADLSAYTRQRGLMPMPDVVRMVREVGDGLAAAAAAGVVHRDVKPNNIFRLQEETAGVRFKVLDFGVSKLRGSTGTLTEGQVVGTPSYMAPEQALGEDVDHRADLYGLAAVAYRCLLGRPPFVGRDATRVLLDVVQYMPPQPSSVGDVPPQLDEVFAVALAKSPEHRFDDPEALARALENAAAGQLDDTTQRRARRLLADLPWGASRA